VPENNYAILMGLDRYADRHLSTLSFAEKDATDLAAVLSDPVIGNFPPGNIVTILGEELTTRAAEKILYTNVVKNRKPGDVIVVYWSCHGFRVGPQQKAYLGTYDVQIDQLTDNPNAGLRLEYIHEEIFTRSPAQYILFILDCCHSGAFVPESLRSSSPPEEGGVLDFNLFSRGGAYGRVALVACRHDAVSRESATLKNGVFTHYLLKGLRGGAAEPETGEVTLDSLLSYVRNNTPSEQLPGRYGQDFGRVALTKPGIPRKERRALWAEARALVGRQTAAQHIPPVAVTVPLTNPLDPYQPFITKLVDAMSVRGAASDFGEDANILEMIRRASDAELAFILAEEHQRCVPRATSGLGGKGAKKSSLEAAITRVAPAVSACLTPSNEGHGQYNLYEDAAGNAKADVVIPLGRCGREELLVVSGLTPDAHLLGDVYGLILATVFKKAGTGTVEPMLVEAAILDELKRVYGFVPLAMYARRYELFCQRLRHMTVYFQSIVYLHPNMPSVNSWEALARDPRNEIAPFDLFDAAEMWGVRFKLELDMFFLQLSMHRYQEELMKLPGGINNVLELSVNVYPDSLMCAPYFDAMQQVIKSCNIPPEKLVLEISEKTPIPEHLAGCRGGAAFEAFRERLESYVKDFRFAFAIDDFGVGHASATRLSRLRPEYVKIDRDVLLQDLGHCTISYVIELVGKHSLRSPKVVVEGFDDDSRIPLSLLYQLGVRYIQGFKIDKARPELNMLKPRQKKLISQLLK
jgi:EAL domain-containing protein (putative c-di-GMP-specific phosphodiesterase class I)